MFSVTSPLSKRSAYSVDLLDKLAMLDAVIGQARILCCCQRSLLRGEVGMRVLHQLAQQRAAQALRLAFHHCVVKIVQQSKENGVLAVEGLDPYRVLAGPRQ